MLTDLMMLDKTACFNGVYIVYATILLIFSNKYTVCSLSTATCNLDYIGYAHVTPDKAVFTEKEKVKIKCHKGFQLNGTSSLECTRHGNWSHVFPKCAGMNNLF